MPRNAHTYAYFRGLACASVDVPPGINAMHMLNGARDGHTLVDLWPQAVLVPRRTLAQAEDIARVTDVLGLTVCAACQDVWRSPGPPGAIRRLYGSD